MADPTALQRIRENSLNLSAKQLNQLVGGAWPDVLIRDYLAQIENIEALATDSTEIEDRITVNEEDITLLKQEDINLQNQISSNDDDIVDLKQEDINLQNQISSNDDDIVDLKQEDINLQNQISSNDDDIVDLQQEDINLQNQINTNASNLSTHISDNGAHGVTGNNVGDEDFAQALVGGVVYLAALVADAVDSSATVTTADAGSAPATYDQTYIQSLADLANDTKAQHNQLLSDLNDAITVINAILSSMQTANQMANV